MYDKSKKTWSQRLKITKSEKTHSTPAAPTEQQQALLRYQQQQQKQQQLLVKPEKNAAIITRNTGETSTKATTTTATSKSTVTPQTLSTYKHASNGALRGGGGGGRGEGGIGVGVGVSTYDFAPSALSRSMKYAEPWIYGTVRGLPNSARPYYYQTSTAALQHGYMVANPAAIFAHPFATSELAIVICSCPEYLSGTKRDLKKASVCKKCKGSRLPLTPIGGTVRLHPSTTPLMLKARCSGSATMRITTSGGHKLRPTILDPQKDPYDLMRRSRLLSPEPAGVAAKLGTASPSPSSKSSEVATARNRGKNPSPTRGRSRTRTNLPQPTSKAKKNDTKGAKEAKEAKSSSSASVSSVGSFKDCWLVEEPEVLCASLAGKASVGESTRRSILRCNVNPYDLISCKSVSSAASASSKPSTPTAANAQLAGSHKIRSQNEFMAPAEDDDFDVADANLYDAGPPSFSPYNKRVSAGTLNHAGGVTQRPSSEESTVNKGSSNHEDTAHVASDTGKEDVGGGGGGGGGGGVDSNAAAINKNNNSYTNIQAIAGQRISLGETGRVTKKSLIKQSEDGRVYESIIIAGDDEPSVDKREQRHCSEEIADLEAVEQPKRPPRNVRRCDLQEGPEEATTTTTATKHNNATKQQTNAAGAPTHGIQLVSVPPSPPIKSILKRPTCLALSELETMVNQPSATATATATPENAAATIGGGSRNSGPRHSRREAPCNSKREPGESNLSSTSPASASATATASATTTTTATTPTATFYIPLPQSRKKVQFMMEDRIIRVDEHVGNDNDNYNNSSNNSHNANVVTEEDEVEFGEAPSTTTPIVATAKSLNYEYYERKRKQQKLMLDKQQQHQQNRTATVANLGVQQTSKSDENSTTAAAIDVATNNSATSAALEPLNNSDDVSTTAIARNTTTSQQQQKTATLTASLENESNLVSSAADAEGMNHAIHKPSNNSSSINNNNNNKLETTDVQQQQQQHIAAVKTSNSNSRTNELSYRDIAAPRKEENERFSLCTADTPASATPAALQKDASWNAVAGDAEEMLWLLLVPSQADDCQQPDRPEQRRQAKPKPQQLRAFVAPDDDDEMPALSRSPIRRSHSVRHPSAAGDVADSRKNDTIFKFKDTMALRMRNVRLDARDLFASAASTSQRPKEPPPPPPHAPATAPAPEATANTTQLITATALNPATSTRTTQVGTKASTSSGRSSLLSPSFGSVARTLSPAGHTQQQHDRRQQQEHQQTAINADADEDKHPAAARNTAFSRCGLGHHNERQQHEEPPHQRQQSTTMHQVVVVAAGPGAAADRGTRPTATKNEYERDSNSNASHSNDNSNKSTSCQAVPTRTSSCDKNDVAPSTLATRASNAANAKTAVSTTPPTATPHNNHNTNSTLFAKKPTSTTQQRTVVRVAPFNKVGSEVHRLKISHSDEHSASFINYHKGGSSDCSFHFGHNDDYFWRHATSSPVFGGLAEPELSPLTAQKKTSILINGDDCYSTMNISHDALTPLYHSSVVVADYSSTSTEPPSPTQFEGLRVSSTTNTVTINVGGSAKRSAEEELIYQHNQINSFLSKQADTRNRIGAAIIPINGSSNSSSTSRAENGGLHRSASSVSSASATSSSSCTSSGSGSNSNSTKPKRCRTLIKLDYDKELPQMAKGQQQHAEPLLNVDPQLQSTTATTATTAADSSAAPVLGQHEELLSHEVELVKILRNPVEAVRRNLVPHVCGRSEHRSGEGERSKKMCHSVAADEPSPEPGKLPARDAPTGSLLLSTKIAERNSFIAKLLEDPTLNQVAEGLENETIVQLIENSLKRLKDSRSSIDTSGTKDNDDMMRLINMSLQKLREERLAATSTPLPPKEEDGHSNRGSISSATSFSSANNYEMFEFDTKSESDCYQSCSSEITSPGDEESGSSEAAATRSKFYQMLVDATLAEIEISTGLEDEDVEHHYESIRNNADPIYEEITDMPPPLPLSAPPLNDAELDKKAARSMFEGASKYDILSYLVDAKERGLVREEPAFEYPQNCSNPIIIEEEAIDTLSDLGKRKQKIDGRDTSLSRASVMSDSSEDNQSTMSSLSPPPAHCFLGGGGSGLLHHKGNAADIERNDSGVGSETSKTSRSKYQHPLPATTTNMLLHKNSPIHLCEDCDGPVEMQLTDSGVMFAPLVCRKCGKKRAERKEIITEIVETEEKYGRDLQIVLEEFCQPMLVAGLLTQEQLSAIFLNTEELLENNQTLAERMRDALDIALEQGDDDLLTVNIGRIFLDFTQMLHAFESYCVRQAGASLLLANLEKEKELLRIFLKVSQMENTVLRRMNLNSFLMVPVQRVTKYPLLLARLYKVTPAHLEGRDLLKQAQEKIELHLNHINQEAKDVPTKLWRRISSSSPNRRASCEIDMINIKLRKMAIDVLEWNHDEVRFAMEGKLLYTQPTDSNWKKARTIKLTPVNALLVTNGKPSGNYKAEKAMSDKLNFPKHTGVREASLLVVKEKCGRYTLLREPLYLDRCVVCSEADWDDYFEVQEISSKDTFIFKAEDGVRTKQWYTQLQYHAQGMGAWRKRRNALANIMINGMLARS